VIVAAVSERAVIVLEVRLAQFEEPNETWNDQCQEPEHLLERRQTQDEREEKQKFQLEQLEHDQQGNQQLLYLLLGWNTETVMIIIKYDNARIPKI